MLNTSTPEEDVNIMYLKHVMIKFFLKSCGNFSLGKFYNALAMKQDDSFKH